MNNLPIVSIITPSYNRAHLIRRAIHSVLAQTYQDWELWIVDDHSADDTERVVKAFSDQRIHYLRHEANCGASAARNTGIKASRGKYVAFLDSDDEWMPSKLEKQLALFQTGSTHLGLVYSACVRIQDGKESAWRPSLRGFVYDKIMQGTFDLGILFVVSRAALDFAGGFDESLPALEDYDLFLRISQKYEADFIEDVTVIVHQASGEDRLSNNLKRQILSFEVLLQKHFRDLERNRRTLAMWLAKAGGLCCLCGEIKKERWYYTRSLKAWPFQLKPLLHVVLSCGPGLHQAFFTFWRRVYWRSKKTDC